MNTLTVSLEGLAERINAEHEQCEVNMRAGVEHAIKAGELLIEAKALCAHGEWGNWLQANCEFSERTAQAYMRLAREWPGLADSKAQRVADLSMRGALLMLAAPRVASEQEIADKWDAEGAELKRLIQHVKAMLDNPNLTIWEAVDAERIAEYCVERQRERWRQSKYELLGALAELGELGDYLPAESPFTRIKIDPFGDTFNRRDWQKIDDWADAFAQAAQERYDEITRDVEPCANV